MSKADIETRKEYIEISCDWMRGLTSDATNGRLITEDMIKEYKKMMMASTTSNY